jgi:hypothetical protein
LPQPLITQVKFRSTSSLVLRLRFFFSSKLSKGSLTLDGLLFWLTNFEDGHCLLELFVLLEYFFQSHGYNDIRNEQRGRFLALDIIATFFN